MKKLFIMIAAGMLLLSNCNLLYAVDFTPETFLNIRNTLSSYSGVYYDYDTNNIASCDSNDTPVNPVRGCIRYPIRQEAGDFVVDGESLDYVPKNVQVKKMILPTNKEGEFQIALLVRGKNNGQVSSNQKICSVVVFDKSSSMGFMSGGKVYTGDKWNAAVSGAMEFSNFIMSNNSNSELGLVFFSQTGYVKQTLSNTGFKQSDFDEASTKLQGWTNIHDGLIKAGEMFEGHDCDKKFIILMSDGLSNQRMVKDGDGNRILFTSEDENDERDTTKASAAATGEALNLKNQSIEIFSIGYDMGNVSNPILAVNTLKDIASEPEESHYKDATTEDIEEIYRIIGGNLIEVGASILISLKDFLGNNILGDDINITEESNITSSGVVYSFPIRINPSATGWNESNDGLVLNYLDASGNPDSLEIPKSKTSQIYWEQPKCEGSYPSGNNIVTGNDTFTQTWVIPTPSNRGTDESQNNSLELSPIFMDWRYTDSENPGECEWTCTPGYHKQGEGCEKDTYTVTFNPTDGTGTMEPQVINNGEATHLSKNTFTKTGYTFSGWNDDPKPESGTRYADEEEVTDLVGTGGSITLYARWTPNPYTIKFDKNGGAGTMEDQDMTYDTYANLHKNTYTRDGYTFSGWNTEPNGSGTPYTDEKSVKNLATTGTVTLYAQWTAIANTTYEVTFNPTIGTGTMEPQVINSNEATKLSKNTFTLTGYTFSGWNTSAKRNGTGYADEEEVTDLVGAGGSITLYARWTPNPYTIKFDKNGGSGTMDDQDMSYDTYDNLKENTYTRDEYTFKGWNTEPDGSGTPYTDKAYVNNLATSGTITLYAQRGKKNTGGASGGGGGGGGKITKDDCPDGDYSGNFYDKKCGSKVNTGKIEEESKENQVKPTTVEYKTDTKKCSIEGSKHSAEVNEAYIWACQNGIIKSQTIQGARLGEFLNRAEMAKIITIFEMLILDSKPNRNKDCSAFADSISGYNEEMKNYMITSCQLERMGIHTADHKPIKDFMPKKFVSRAEFGTILSRTLWGNKYEAIKNSANYYVEHLSTLKGGKILSNINPDLKERRSYAILMIYRAAKYLGKA